MSILRVFPFTFFCFLSLISCEQDLLLPDLVHQEALNYEEELKSTVAELEPLVCSIVSVQNFLTVKRIGQDGDVVKSSQKAQAHLRRFLMSYEVFTSQTQTTALNIGETFYEDFTIRNVPRWSEANQQYYYVDQKVWETILTYSSSMSFSIPFRLESSQENYPQASFNFSINDADVIGNPGGVTTVLTDVKVLSLENLSCSSVHVVTLIGEGSTAEAIVTDIPLILAKKETNLSVREKSDLFRSRSEQLVASFSSLHNSGDLFQKIKGFSTGSLSKALLPGIDVRFEESELKKTIYSRLDDHFKKIASKVGP